MGSIPLNFSNMKKFDAVPAQDYPIVCSEANIGTSKAGNPKLQLVLEIEEGEKAGQKLWLEHSLLEESMWAVARSIEALTGEEISSETGEFNLDSDDLVGRRAVARVSIDDSYDGTPRNKVDRLFHPTAVPA